MNIKRKIGDVVIINNPKSAYNGQLADVIETEERRVRLNVCGEKLPMWFFLDEVV